jgi:hypothetical protein
VFRASLLRVGFDAAAASCFGKHYDFCDLTMTLIARAVTELRHYSRTISFTVTCQIWPVAWKGKEVVWFLLTSVAVQFRVENGGKAMNDLCRTGVSNYAWAKQVVLKFKAGHTSL